MTQRVFDTDNEKDMALLWSILPDCVKRISPMMDKSITYIEYENDETMTRLLNIEWYGKPYIDRPKQEATEADIGKLCYFWDDDDYFYGKLDCILSGRGVRYSLGNGMAFNHCRRLTKQEIEELC